MTARLDKVKLTDDAVAGLPLHLGRAELLEEIMSTPVLDDRPIRADRPRRRTTWLVPAAAAVLVAALALGAGWWATAGPDGQGSSGFASQPEVGGDSVLLSAPGWAITSASAEDDSGEMTYEKGADSLDIMWGPADSYEGYVEDRRHIVDPPAAGEPIQVLGRDAQLWAYSADDHTAIREVEDGTWIELRGAGMRKAGYLALLDDLRLVDLATFEAALPGSFVTSEENAAAVAEILDGISDFAHPLLPSGVARSSIASDQNDPYQLGVEVAGAVACAWFDEYAGATRAGADRRAQRAAGILTSARDWPVLKEIDAQGGYSEVVWSLADEVAAGQVPDWYVDGLGCDG
jgi:hypothetical protein